MTLFLAVSLPSLPWEGVEFVHIKRLNLFVAAAAAILLGLRHVGAPWVSRRGFFLGAAGALAALAAVGYVNFFSFHGENTYLHLHDVSHYYLGSKYYAELGYTELYTAMLRAEAETHDNHFKAIEARDLRTYRRVHIRTLLQRSDPVKAAFTEARWESFKIDVEFFRSRLGPLYGTVLLDHGFNPTPVWALVGGSLSNLVPAGSRAGILLLSLIDPILLAAALALTAWAFGVSAALLGLIHFCVIFGATFGWTGGAFMRYPWFLGVVAAACFLRRGKHAAAGLSLAVATSVRIFPVFFALPLAFKAVATVIARVRRPGSRLPRSLLPPKRYLWFFGSFAAALLLSCLATSALPRGLGHWLEFRTNMATHVETISPNMVGMTEALSYRPGGAKVTQEEFQALKLRRQRIYTAQILLLFLPALAAAALLSQRLTDAGSLILALPLLYLGLSLASYYYAFLVLLMLVFRSRPRELALVFAAEAIPYALMLLEEHEPLLYIYRGLALLGLYTVLFLRPGRVTWSQLSRLTSGDGRTSSFP
jgi:hypothetical protein